MICTYVWAITAIWWGFRRTVPELKVNLKYVLYHMHMHAYTHLVLHVRTVGQIKVRKRNNIYYYSHAAEARNTALGIVGEIE